MNRPIAIALLLLARVKPCAESSDATATNIPVADCNELLAAMGAAADRCVPESGVQYQAMILPNIANGSCNNITATRNHDTLQNVCIPSFTTISCDDLAAEKFDPECQLQLVQATPQP